MGEGWELQWKIETTNFDFGPHASTNIEKIHPYKSANFKDANTSGEHVQ